jgi:hypothetical protein
MVVHLVNVVTSTSGTFIPLYRSVGNVFNVIFMIASIFSSFVMVRDAIERSKIVGVVKSLVVFQKILYILSHLEVDLNYYIS